MPQQYEQKYTIVCFFEAQERSLSFSALDWPLHVTIIDTFKTAWPVSTLARAVQDAAATTAPFDVEPVEQAMLGPDKDEAVKLLRQDAEILALHKKLLALTDDGTFVFNTPEFVGKGFLPHATDQKSGNVQIGRKYRLTSISLVDMFPGDDYMQRVIVDTFNFKS